MTLLTVLRACTKPTCVIKAGGIHTLYIHYSSNTDNIAKQMRHSTNLQKFKSLLMLTHTAILKSLTRGQSRDTQEGPILKINITKLRCDNHYIPPLLFNSMNEFTRCS